MDYRAAFRPIFSLAAHAAQAVADGRAAAVDPDSLRADLERLLARARRGRADHGGERFDQAWFPLCAWLNETMGRFPGETNFRNREGHLRRHVQAGDAGGEFFERLNLHLYAAESGENASGELAVIDVYRSALELGFLGRYHRPEDRPRREVYLKRCREALAAGSGRSGGLSEEDCPVVLIVPERRGAGSRSFWMLPVLVTIGLFLFYRLLLSDLYAMVVG